MGVGSFYRMTPEEIINLIEAILNTPGAEIQDKSIIAATLKLYGSKNIDFIDAWIIAFAKNKNVKTIYTFDKKHFRDIGEVEAMSP
ncbi:MAG: PIN domain-containing protein [Proteobacteria bacterium]|nr:PIN domain-containing protein [Pseudomonadota bacterium]